MNTYSPRTPEQVASLAVLDNAFNLFTDDDIKLINRLLYKLINVRLYTSTGLYVSDSALLGINKFSVYKKLFEISHVLTQPENFNFLLEKEYISTPLTGEEIDLFCKVTYFKAIPIDTFKQFCEIFNKSYETDFS